MTQEEKELLLEDICGRLPYGVKVDHFGTVKELLGIMPSSENVMVGYDINDYEDSVIEDIKPYLRPWSSITEKEIKEIQTILCDAFDDTEMYTISILGTEALFKYLNKKMIDYRGLIEKGLALEAKEGMYNS